MSTLPRDPAEAGHATVLPARRDLEQVVREFQVAAERLGIPRPVARELNDFCHHVAAFTAELFPGEMRVRVKNDPEIPEDLYVLFGVDAIGNIADIAAKNDEWHATVCRLPSSLSGVFRLSVAVR